MSDFDLERLGDVWRQQLDPAEMERLQRTAAAVSRRARLGQRIDAAAAFAVAAVVVLLVASNPRIGTFLMGGAAIVVMLASHVRQRQLRKLELEEVTGGTEDMLAQSVARVEMTLKRTRMSLIAFAPAILVGWVFMSAVTDRPVRELLPNTVDKPLLALLGYGGFLVMLTLGAIYFVSAYRRSRQELEHLVAMRDAYREERESTSE